jgi:hypothetical protein
MRVLGCGQCEWLWDEYTDATFALVKLNADVKMASLRYEPLGVMVRLNEEVIVAARRRDAALAGLKQHETTHQTHSAAAAS